MKTKTNAKEIFKAFTEYTTLPANLVAIVPVVGAAITRAFEYFEVIPQISLSKIVIPLGSFELVIPLQSLTFVLILYLFFAGFYRNSKTVHEHEEQKNRMKEPIGEDYALTQLRQFTQRIVFFGAVVFLWMAAFVISVIDGFVLFLICLIAFFFWNRWEPSTSKNSLRTLDIEFRDVGLHYLIWIPLVYLIFEVGYETNLAENIFWAWLYLSCGYLITFLIAKIVDLYLRRWINYHVDFKFSRIGKVAVPLVIFVLTSYSFIALWGFEKFSLSAFLFVFLGIPFFVLLMMFIVLGRRWI